MLLPARKDHGAGLDTRAALAEDDYRARVLTGNVGFRREVFDRIGGFNEQLRRGDDLDFGWRAAAAGFEPAFVSEAVVHYGAEWRVARVARKAYADGSSWATLYVLHREHGLAAPSRDAVLARYRDIARGPASHAWKDAGPNGWVYDVAHAAGRIAGSIRNHVMFL
jgi:GT2 family glycosyltransferase